MINYEKQKTEIDEILERNLWFGVEEETKKVAPCPQMNCFKCLFHDERDSCHCGLRSMKWLVSEYKEPEIDWSKVPIDTPVLVRHGDRWLKRHFAGVDDNGQPTAWNLGVTSWSEQNALRITCADMKLAEVE